MIYISRITGKAITELELEDWMDDIYTNAERNIGGYLRPLDALQRTIRILQLDQVDEHRI